MSNLIKLLAISFLMTSCDSMSNKCECQKKQNTSADQNVSRSATSHVSHVTNHAANTASTVSSAAKQIFSQ